MNMAKYCKNKGMTLEQYHTFKNNIKVAAQTIKDQTTYTHGMYYPVNDIINESNPDIKCFIIQELKKLGFEFLDNSTLYRY